MTQKKREVAAKTQNIINQCVDIGFQAALHTIMQYCRDKETVSVVELNRFMLRLKAPQRIKTASGKVIDLSKLMERGT